MGVSVLFLCTTTLLVIFCEAPLRAFVIEVQEISVNKIKTPTHIKQGAGDKREKIIN